MCICPAKIEIFGRVKKDSRKCMYSKAFDKKCSQVSTNDKNRAKKENGHYTLHNGGKYVNLLLMAI